MEKIAYLVIGADKSLRAAYRPRVGLDEVAIPIRLRFSDGWGRVLREREIGVDVPDFAPEVIGAGEQDQD